MIKSKLWFSIKEYIIYPNIVIIVEIIPINNIHEYGET